MAVVAFTTRANLVAGNIENIADVTSCLDALLAGVNSVADTQLASPNNAIWRTLAEQEFTIGQSVALGTYWFNGSVSSIGAPVASGVGGTPAPVNLDPTEFVVAGKTAKLRLRVSLITGGAPGTSPVFGIYLVSALAGTTSITVTLGAVLASSTATFTTPAANAYTSTASSTFDFPAAAGNYLFGVNLPGATAANSVMSGRMQLAISHV